MDSGSHGMVIHIVNLMLTMDGYPQRTFVTFYSSKIRLILGELGLGEFY